MSTKSLRARLVLAVVILLAAAPAAHARRESVSAAELTARMEAAEARFAKAAVAIRNDDPDARRESDAALQDMEDVMNACAKVRGCPMNSLLATYNRLLKQSVDADADDETDDEPAAGALGHEGLATDVPEAAHAAALLSEDHRFDRMVEYNPAVQQAIRRWLTDMRGSLLTSWENYQYMRGIMWPEYQKRGLPEALLFGIMAKESNGKVHATSRAGAAGPMQFMYATGRRFGLGDDGTGFDTRYDPRSAAQASAEYLNERMRELNRNIELSLAAYNGGEGRALRVYQGTGATTFWDESVYNQFPAETRDYVPMVIAAAWLFLHPKEYGLTFPKVSHKPAPLRLTQPASIYQLSICLGNKGVREGYMRTLRNLNPRWQPDTFMPAGTVLNATTSIVRLYDRWCTTGARADLAKTLVLSDPSRAIVRAGPLQQTATSNGGVGADGDDAVTAPTVPDKADASADSAPAARKPVAATHRVERGESLEGIARRYDCAVATLANANGIRKPSSIRPGQMLRLEGCSR